MAHGKFHWKRTAKIDCKTFEDQDMAWAWDNVDAPYCQHDQRPYRSQSDIDFDLYSYALNVGVVSVDS